MNGTISGKEVINSCDDTKGIGNGNQIQQTVEKINNYLLLIT